MRLCFTWSIFHLLGSSSPTSVSPKFSIKLGILLKPIIKLELRGIEVSGLPKKSLNIAKSELVLPALLAVGPNN